jgi:uncharacterized protein (DUF2267 family)
MTITGLPVFDKTVHETNMWLKHMMAQLETTDRQRALAATRAALHALRDRIGPENACHLGAQLPMLLRGLYYESWSMAATPSKERHLADYLEHVRRELPADCDLDPEEAARALFTVLEERVAAGESAKLRAIFPTALRGLWPPEANAA